MIASAMQYIESVLAINQLNRNKTNNKAKFHSKTTDFITFIQNNINEHIEFE